MKYRKRPVEVEAVQWMGTVFSDYPEWIHEAKQAPKDAPGSIFFDPAKITHNQYFSCYIFTLEGIHECKPGTFVIRGINGELYPCKPDIFALTYEQVDAKTLKP